MDILLQDINQIFNIERFQIPHQPIKLWHINLCKYGNLPCVLDMPIKLNNQTTYILPPSIIAINDLIEHIDNFEKTINPLINDYYCYLGCSE